VEEVSKQSRLCKRLLRNDNVPHFDIGFPLFATGGKANHHLGNKLYRKLVNEMKKRYRSTEDKDEKTDMSRSIVDQVCGYGGRFVKKDSGSNRYYVLSKSEARIKTSQALRENRDTKTNGTALSDDDSDCESSGSKSFSPSQVVETMTMIKGIALDTDCLDCCQALVSLSRSITPPLTSKAA
jgi:hypothetical protein